MGSQSPDRDARANVEGDRAIANSEARSSRPTRFIFAAALAVLVVGVGCSLLGAWRLKKASDTSDREYFDRLSERITTETKRRLRTYVYGLNGARSVYRSSKSVERGEFRAFVNRIDLRQEFPGALGFSFIQRVPRGELDAFIAAERADEAPGFAVRTTGNLPELYVTKFIEPREANREAEGFDIATEPVRREAADRAMLTGEPTLSGKITLLQDKQERVGFLYLVPVYGNDTNPATPEERRRDLVGWISMPMLVEETMAGVTDAAGKLLDVEIYDGPQTTRAAMLYDEDRVLHAVPDASAGTEDAARRFHDRTTLDVGGREWTLWLGSTKALDATRDRATAIVAGAGGTTISCLLAIVIWGLGTGRARALAIAREMTADLAAARDRAESALRETEALHSTLNEHAIVSVVDASGRITAINDTFCRISGYSREELLGQDHRILNSGHHPKSFWVDMWRTIASERAWHGDVCNRAKDGSLYWVDSNIAPFRSADGRIEKYVSIRSDITQRKRTEEEFRALTMDLERRVEQRAAELKASEARYRTLFDSIDEGFCIIEIIFDEQERPIDYRFLEISPSFEKQTGLRDAVGKRMRELAPRHEEHWFEIYGRIAVTGEATRFQNHAEQLDRWYDVYAFRFGDPKDRQVAILFRDITEQRHMESAMRHAKEEADKANLAKSEFLAHMSHEIRTPLNGVIGMTDLLLSTELSDQQRRFAGLAKNSAESLTTVINDILDFSKIEAGKLEIVTSEFNLHHAAEQVMELLAQTAAKKGLEIACQLAPEVPANVRGDPDRLRQILVNLVNNALKFTTRGAVVLRLSLDAEHDGRATVRFAVTDTGIGIPKDRIAHLFKSFSQADASTTRLYGGTGLGLAISKRLAELMGGRIGVESEEGRGSTFWVTLALEALPTPRACRGSPGIDATQLHVLAVSASASQRETLVEQIRSWGISAQAASDEPQATQIIAESFESGEPFDVVIIDGESGAPAWIKLAATIRRMPAHRHTALIALLSIEDPLSLHELKQLGFNARMTKPVRQSMLFDAISSALAASQIDPDGAGEAAPESAPAVIDDKHLEARILLAEDNKINQIVASEMLTKVGYRCDIVADGKQAVEAVFARHYDLVLMDCQMPIMDGFEATRTIRKREQIAAAASETARHIPIIALTANAMKGDEQECLVAGMDAYSAKPFDFKRLNAAIVLQLSKAGRPAQHGSEAAGERGPTAPVNSDASVEFDLDSILDRCMNDVAVVEMILDKFAEQAAGDVSRLEASIRAGDSEEVRKVAHALKGAAGIISANELTTVALELEQMGRQRDLANAGETLEKLRQLVERCLADIPRARSRIAAQGSLSPNQSGGTQC